jgi:hypothetical protein
VLQPRTEQAVEPDGRHVEPVERLPLLAGELDAAVRLVPLGAHGDGDDGPDGLDVAAVGGFGIPVVDATGMRHLPLFPLVDEREDVAHGVGDRGVEVENLGAAAAGRLVVGWCCCRVASHDASLGPVLQLPITVPVR